MVQDSILSLDMHCSKILFSRRTCIVAREGIEAAMMILYRNHLTAWVIHFLGNWIFLTAESGGSVPNLNSRQLNRVL